MSVARWRWSRHMSVESDAALYTFSAILAHHNVELNGETDNIVSFRAC